MQVNVSKVYIEMWFSDKKKCTRSDLMGSHTAQDNYVKYK